MEVSLDFHFSVVQMLVILSLGEFGTFDVLVETKLSPEELWEKTKEVLIRCTEDYLEKADENEVVSLLEVSDCVFERLEKVGLVKVLNPEFVAVDVPELFDDTIKEDVEELKKWFGEELAARLVEHNRKAWEKLKKRLR